VRRPTTRNAPALSEAREGVFDGRLDALPVILLYGVGVPVGRDFSPNHRDGPRPYLILEGALAAADSSFKRSAPPTRCAASSGSWCVAATAANSMRSLAAISR